MNTHRTAVLIACKNGEGTIVPTVRSAVTQADVFVVSDGSTDATPLVARSAGARVLELAESRGKPAALRAGMQHFSIESEYDFVAVLDDDTTIAPDYTERISAVLDREAGVAAASGRIDSLWLDSHRWNVLIAMRAFMYWSYQATIKRGQNALHVVNVICGANSIFRTAVFAQLVATDPPYAIDDMYWLAEVVRARLGRVAYVHSARSWTIDPHTFRDWYRQTVRWSWAQFQSIRGHRLGLPVQRTRNGRFPVRLSWFDIAYLALLLDWLPYMLEPLAIVPLAIYLRGWIDPLWFAVFYVATTTVWISIGAIALRKPRLVLLTPAILVLDLVYRFTMMHALVKAIASPRSATCRWDSPTRFRLGAGEADG